MKTSPEIGSLAAALSAAQGKMRPALRESENPYFKSRYADLASVWEAIRGPLSEAELAVIQTCRGTETGIEVETMLAHSSGQWVSDSLYLPASKLDAQGYCQAVTYARRYGLMAVVGVAPDDDDDGNAASQPPRRDVQGRPAPKPATKPASKPEERADPVPTPKFRDRMLEVLRESGIDDDSLLNWAIGQGIVTEVGGLNTWPLDQVPTDKRTLDQLIARIKSATADPADGPPEAESFWDVTITVPRAGTKRADYMQNPDTIRSLYEAGKGGDDGSRRRLWGLSKEWAPKAWTTLEGNTKQPSEADVKCRKALDAFLEWEEEKQ